jgi:hypothetical protein
MGTKEDESSTGRIWAAGFHHVTDHSCLAHVLKRPVYVFNFPIPFFLGHGKPRITETTDTESVDTGARLYSILYSSSLRCSLVILKPFPSPVTYPHDVCDAIRG